MLPPNDDLEDRQIIWEAMQVFWLDTDWELYFEESAQICAGSKYSISELEKIYFNEVVPALWINIFGGVWAGFDSDWIKDRVLKTNRFGKKIWGLQRKLFGPTSWPRLAKRVTEIRDISNAN